MYRVFQTHASLSKYTAPQNTSSQENAYSAEYPFSRQCRISVPCDTSTLFKGTYLQWICTIFIGVLARSRCSHLEIQVASSLGVAEVGLNNGDIYSQNPHRSLGEPVYTLIPEHDFECCLSIFYQLFPSVYHVAVVYSVVIYIFKLFVAMGFGP
jgi:hypothetical protein